MQILPNHKLSGTGLATLARGIIIDATSEELLEYAGTKNMELPRMAIRCETTRISSSTSRVFDRIAHKCQELSWWAKRWQWRRCCLHLVHRGVRQDAQMAPFQLPPLSNQKMSRGRLHRNPSGSKLCHGLVLSENGLNNSPRRTLLQHDH